MGWSVAFVRHPFRSASDLFKMGRIASNAESLPCLPKITGISLFLFQVRVMLPLESGDGPMILRSSGAAYELRDLSPVLTYLAPCLPAEIYGARNND